jgi:hypothetical protein
MKRQKMSKMQRKARSKRKTWTTARRFELKHARELEAQQKQMKVFKKMLKQMTDQAAAKVEEAEHDHSEPLALPENADTVVGDEILPASE